MARNWIVVGDLVGSGGSVISGSPYTDIDGKPMARVGDRVVCARHGPGTIASGDQTMNVDGQPAARHGDFASCGCQLVSASQFHAFVDPGSGAAKAASSPQTTLAPQAAPNVPNASTPSPLAAQTGASNHPSNPACWIADYSKAISVDGDGRYSEAIDKNGNKHNYNIPKRFSISVPAKTGGNFVVEVKIKVHPQANVAVADVTKAKSDLLAGIASHWNGKFSLEVDDPVCGKKTFPIEYKATWVTSGEHYTMKIHASYPREGVTGHTIDVSKTTTPWIYAHEFGHCVGVPDEYSYTPDNETVQYYKPDGTLDPAAIPAPPNKPATDVGATIMSTYGNTTTLPRHAWSVAREAQELLTSRIGRTITCTVI